MWEIYAYQNGESLAGIFNAIVALMGSSHYTGAIATAVFCGFFAALLAYAFAPHKLQGWYWLISVTLIFTFLIVPKVTVGIIDKTGGAPVKIIDHVPLGVAALGGITSAVGSVLTTLFETAFQFIPGAGALPAELTYQKNGLLFGNRLIRETGRVVFRDPLFRTDLINFIHNCTMYDLMDGTLKPATFAQSANVWGLMDSPNPARFSTVTTMDSAITIDTCPNIYHILNTRIPAQVERLQGQLAFRLNPTLPAATAMSAIAAQIKQAYVKNQLADASASAADIIRQNALLNAISDTGQMAGQRTHDWASTLLAVGRAKAIAQQNAAWLNGGKVAEQALPVMRNVIEALSYALFPLIVLLLMLSSGQETLLALKAYAALLIWIQLWSPLYAILNYMGSLYAAYDLAAAADLGNGSKVLSLQTAAGIYRNALSGEATVGYLVISIPMIAWGVVQRLATAATTLAAGVSALQASLARTSSEAAAGNLSLGNVTQDQMRLSPNRTSAFMNTWQDDASGDTFSAHALNGRTAVSLLRNQGYATHTVTTRVSKAEVAQADRQVESAGQEVLSARTERAAIFTSLLSQSVGHVRTTQSQQGASQRQEQQHSKTLTHLDKITQALSETSGLTYTQVAQLAFGAAASLGANNQKKKKEEDGQDDQDEDESEEEDNHKIIGVGVHAEAKKRYQARLTAEQQQVLNALTAEQISAFKQFGEQVTQSANTANSSTSRSDDSHGLAAQLVTATTRLKQAEAALAVQISYQERLSSAHEQAEALTLDVAQDPHNLGMFMRYVEHYGGTTASALAMFDAELARQGLKPNQTLSDGTAMPISFGAIQAEQATHLADLKRYPDPNTVSQYQRQHIPRKTLLMWHPLPEPETPVAITAEVQAAEQRLQQTIQTQVQTHEQTTAIHASSAGIVSTKKSLLKRAGQQLGQDAKSALDQTRQQIKRWFKHR